MKTIRSALKKITDALDFSTPQRPLLLDLRKRSERAILSNLLKKDKVKRISDDFKEQSRELFAIQNPRKIYAPNFDNLFERYYERIGDHHKRGKWVYFPWNATLAHILDEDDFFLVRTARNKYLITAKEQRAFYKARIGIAGLSVGSSVAFAIALQGGGRYMKLADMDKLALTNTNRILAGITELGKPKVDMAALKIYEINPYAEIEKMPAGLNKDNMNRFCRDLDVIIDEIDNLAVKCLIREEARRRRIPVVMAADNGDNAVVDIERYDLNPNLPFFHGRIGNVSYEELKNLDKFETGRLITKLVRPENITKRMQYSLLQMGKTIVSWPQLGGAALINGAAVAYCVRKIVTGESLEDNRALISLDEKLIPHFNSAKARAHRLRQSKAFAKRYNIEL